ncbi:MAG: ectoine/hydroxyectoine ABC transporter substrate-binding protein EhuB [Betaproteobacteria bacterium]|nr:ectoine/hydroxyectoine ABC transporter substrate-binding protein EhuB [Betaproteobacteria bacterium]MDH3436630.1 ectoine/hydroxyectoine ABC transporter substrate-binding protein EhuB [Betaproteobacteria bacterium]
MSARKGEGVWRKAMGVALLATALLGTGCSEQADTPAGQTLGTLERAQRDGTIRVGYANEAPYAYLESASRRLTGEAPEIARAVLADMGIGKVEGVLTEFGSLIPGLKAGRFDIIAAGMYILPERCKEIVFSNPTYSVGEAFIVAQGNPLALNGYEGAARHPNARLGVVAGTVERAYARAVGIPDARVVVFPDAPSALEGVIAGRVDAYAATSLTVNNLLARAQSPRVERAAPFSDPVIAGKRARGYGAFGFRKTDQDLVAAFNTALARFIGTPRHLELVKPFGFTRAELPGPDTATELCRG